MEGIFRLHFSDETRPVNIGNPDEITIGDFAEEIIALTGTDQKVVYRELPKTIPSNAALTSRGQRKFWIGRLPSTVRKA